MDADVVCRLLIGLEPQGLGSVRELAAEILPFPGPHVGDELSFQRFAELGAGQLALDFLKVVPEVENRHEVRALILEPAVLLVSSLLPVEGPFPRILNGKRRDNDDELAESSEFCSGDYYPGKPRVDREHGNLMAEPRYPRNRASVLELYPAGHRLQLLKETVAVAYLPGVRRVNEREGLDASEPHD